MADTIVALATPTGRSGIGVIRLSGADALTITRKLVGDGDFLPAPRTAHLRQLYDGDDVIDEAIVTYFKAPHSFTGEDVVEVSCHGSPVLLRQVIDICLRMDARMAEAGEFSLRRSQRAEGDVESPGLRLRHHGAGRRALDRFDGEISHC